jgi:hypothetical protein
LPFLAPKIFPYFIGFNTYYASVFHIEWLVFLSTGCFSLKKDYLIELLFDLLLINFINFRLKYIRRQKDFVVMSYNVRLFNLFKWIDKEDVPRYAGIY